MHQKSYTQTYYRGSTVGLFPVRDSLARKLPIEEVEHERGDLLPLVLEREVASVEQVQFRVGQIAPVRMRAIGRKITSFFPQTMRVGGLRERKNAWNCGYSVTLLP